MMFGRQLTLVAVAAALTGAAGSASAQDARQLQDMKRVIEQQQKQIQAQQQALENLRRQVEGMQQQSEQAAKTATQAQDAAARAQKTAEATAQSPQVSAGQAKIKLQIYGQINQMINTANDGKSTKAYFLSNNNSAPRLGIVGKAQYNDDLTIGPQIEVAVKPNASNKVTQTNETDTSADNTFEARKVEGFAISKTYGAAYLGRGDPSTKDIARIDLSGTDVLDFANVGDMAGLFFRTKDGHDLTNTQISKAFTDFDTGRISRVRYDTPTWHGLTLSGSYGEDQKAGAALRWSADDLFGFRTAAGLGVQDPSQSGVENLVSGSGSVLHKATGLNFTLAGGVESANGDNPYFVYVKPGWQHEFWTIGLTSFSVDWQRTDHQPAQNDKGDSIGAAVVQAIAGYGTELYAGFRWYTLDTGDGPSVEDIYVGTTGVRVKF